MAALKELNTGTTGEMDDNSYLALAKPDISEENVIKANTELLV